MILDRSQSKHHNLATVLLWHSLIVGVSLLHFVIRDGAGLVNDSFAYIQAAQNLHAGKGLTTFDGDGQLEPLTQFSPLVSITLAVVLSADLHLEQASIMMLSACHLATLILLYLMLRRCPLDPRAQDPSTRWLCLGGLLALSINRAGVEVFSFVLSEPLSLFGTSLALAGLSKYLDLARVSDRTWSRALASVLTGVGVAIALASRYAGVALLAAVGLVWLIHQLRISRETSPTHLSMGPRPRWSGKLIDATLIFAPAIATGIAMFAHNRAAGEVGGGRSFGFHPPGLESLEQFLEAAIRWTIGEASTIPLLVGLAFAMIAIVLQTRLHGQSPAQHESKPITTAPGSPAHHIRFVVVTFMLCYVVFIIIAHTFLDGYIPFDLRIFAPAFMCVPVLACAWLAIVSSPAGLRLRRWALVFLAFCIGSQCVSATRWALRAPVDRLGYASQIWRESETMQFIRTRPESEVIYSHQPNAIYLCTGRLARPVPTVFNMLSKRPAEGYVNQLRAMREVLHEKPGVIVYFNRSRSRSRVPADKLASDLPMRLLHQFEDGTVYVISPKD